MKLGGGAESIFDEGVEGRMAVVVLVGGSGGGVVFFFFFLHLLRLFLGRELFM